MPAVRAVSHHYANTLVLAAPDFELAGDEHARPEKLSVGEQQRVAIARAIVNKPRTSISYGK